MEICRKKLDGEYYICLKENHKHLILITPSGHIKDLFRSAFDEPFDIDTSDESNLRLDISQFRLTSIQVAEYRDHLLGIFRSMIDYGESEKPPSDKPKEHNEKKEWSPEEMIIFLEIWIPRVKNMLHSKR